MSRQGQQQLQKDFIKLFERLAYTQSRARVFDDFLDFSLLMMLWSKKASDFDELEKTYPKVDDQRAFAEMLNICLHMANNEGEGFYDPFGDVFMELLSNDRKGQFFTPMDICTMMADMMIPADIEDGKTVYDPACGSGRTLLAAAKINPNLVFYGADVDVTCCKMTVLNMVFNQMEGEVAWMDTLRMTHCKSWHMKKVLAPPPYNVKAVQFVTTDKDETGFVQRAKNTLEVDETKEGALIIGKRNQIKLFD